jgi:hypothetical protein
VICSYQKGIFAYQREKNVMSHPNSLEINPLSPSRLPQPNIVHDLIMMIVLNKIAGEKINTGIF